MEKIYEAIAENDFETTADYLNQLTECSEEQKKLFLSYSTSTEMTQHINKSLKEIASKCQMGNSKDEQHRLKEQESVDNDNERSFDESLSETQALKKYMKGDLKIEKAVALLLNAFKVNIKDIIYDKAVFLSTEIATLISEKFRDTFPKTVRTKSHNLKENSKLCKKVYDMKISASELVNMSILDMKSDELRSTDDLAIKDSILSSQIAKTAAETDIFECGKCKQKKCTYSQLQTRSSDEPMTTFVYCTVCGNRWKF